MVHCDKNITGRGDSSKNIVVAIEEPPKCEMWPNKYSSLETKHVSQFAKLVALSSFILDFFKLFKAP